MRRPRARRPAFVPNRAQARAASALAGSFRPGVHERDRGAQPAHVRDVTREPRAFQVRLEERLVETCDRLASAESRAIERDEVALVGERRGERLAAARIPAVRQLRIERAHGGRIRGWRASRPLVANGCRSHEPHDRTRGAGASFSRLLRVAGSCGECVRTVAVRGPAGDHLAHELTRTRGATGQAATPAHPQHRTRDFAFPGGVVRLRRRGG